MIKLLNILLALFLIACKQEHEDISMTDKFKGLIGNEYRSIKNIKIHGVTMDWNYNKVINHYVITKNPGIGGPEVIFSKSLAIGAIIKIKKVLQCNNCLFGSPINLIVDLDTEKLQPSVPIMLYGLRVKNEEDGSVNLDPMFFIQCLGKC